MLDIFKFDEKIKLSKRKYDLLAVGELLIDMKSEDYEDNFEGNTYKRFFGGSPANIGMNTKRLGINSLVAAAVGEDGLGRFLIKELKSVAIDTSCIQVLEYSTSLVLVTKSIDSPIPIFYRDADYQLKYTKELSLAGDNSSIIHFSCWPISRMPVRDTIERVIENGIKNGSLICFDPNYHPMIWQKGEDGVEFVKSIISKVDIIKPSKDDAIRIFGEATDEKHLEMFLKLGVKLVIMTLGKDGAIVTNGKEKIRFKSLATEVKDVTGAGDAFWSGFYVGIVKEFTIKEALNLGFAVSAYKLKYNGAVVDLPSFETIKEMYGL